MTNSTEGLKNPGTRQQLSLAKKRTTSMIYRKTIMLKMEKKTADTAGAGNVEAPAPTTRERERTLNDCDNVD
jgi:hypothetical protein